MGMFDYVKVKHDCYNCGVVIDEFQSKDSECMLRDISRREVDRYYTSCHNCDVWVEYVRREGPFRFGFKLVTEEIQ